MDPAAPREFRAAPPKTPRARSLGRSAASVRGHERYRGLTGPRVRGSAATFGLVGLVILIVLGPVRAARGVPGRARELAGRRLREQPGLACGGEPGPLGAREPPQVLLCCGHRVRGQETAAARLPLRPPGLAGPVPAGHPRRSPLRCQRPRPLHPRHGLPHLHPPGRPRSGHPKQIFPGQPGAGGELSSGLAAAGGAECPAEPLPGHRQHRPDPHRPPGLCWLQIRGDDCGAAGRAPAGQARLLPGLELVLPQHLRLHDPDAEAEAAVGGGGRGGFGAGSQEPAEDVPDHGHRCCPAPLHVLAHLPPAQVSPKTAQNSQEKSRNSQEKNPEISAFLPKKNSHDFWSLQ